LSLALASTIHNKQHKGLYIPQLYLLVLHHTDTQI
jgi:hypothetical protein